MPPEAARAVIDEYCLGCHDRGGAKGDLVLETFDPANPEQQLPIAEKMIRKLRAGIAAHWAFIRWAMSDPIWMPWFA